MVKGIPPYVTIDGSSMLVVEPTLIGVRRNGFTDSDIQQLKVAYRVIYRSVRRWSDVPATLSQEFAA